MKETAAALRVQLAAPNGSWIDVGILRHRDEITRFESLEEYWETPGRPVLGQIFEERGPEWRPSQRVAVPNWFSHLLPEGRLRETVSRAAGVNAKREFYLLARIGREDLPGAVRVLPHELESEDELFEQLADDADDDAGDPLLKFSLAGLQLKFSVKHGDRGLTIPARGEIGDWIVKLPDGRAGFDGVPEAENATLELAQRVGIVVPDHRLVRVDGIRGLPEWATSGGQFALAVRRYDRGGSGTRVHAEELAQILDIPSGNERAKYRRANFETVASVLGALCGVATIGEIIDRLVLNVLVGNGDAHLKNWAVTYPDGSHPELSPLYDVLPTVAYIPGDDLGLKLGGSRAFRDVRLTSFDRLAERAGWEPRTTRDRVTSVVDRIVEHWDVFRDALPSERYRAVTRHRDGLPLLSTT